MCLPLFSRLSNSGELSSLNVVASKIGTKGGKESMVVNLSSNFCILINFLDFFPKGWDSVFRQSRSGWVGVMWIYTENMLCCVKAGKPQQKHVSDNPSQSLHWCKVIWVYDACQFKVIKLLHNLKQKNMQTY